MDRACNTHGNISNAKYWNKISMEEIVWKISVERQIIIF
jgi:hypothetical protein